MDNDAESCRYELCCCHSVFGFGAKEDEYSVIDIFHDKLERTKFGTALPLPAITLISSLPRVSSPSRASLGKTREPSEQAVRNRVEDLMAGEKEKTRDMRRKQKP